MAVRAKHRGARPPARPRAGDVGCVRCGAAPWGRSGACFDCLQAAHLFVNANGDQVHPLDAAKVPHGGVYSARYRYKPIRCGKESCESCPHEVYVYLVWRAAGRARERYLGPAIAEGSAYELPRLRGQGR